MFLITVAHTTEVNMKTVAAMLNLDKANLRFADEETLKKILCVPKGSVSPFALMYDKGALLAIADLHFFKIMQDFFVGLCIDFGLVLVLSNDFAAYSQQSQKDFAVIAK
jgi:hypothetical protein